MTNIASDALLIMLLSLLKVVVENPSHLLGREQITRHPLVMMYLIPVINFNVNYKNNSSSSNIIHYIN